MPDPTLTNLLPPSRKRAVFRRYLLRLATVTTLFITALVLIAALMLTSTYTFLADAVQTREGQLAVVEKALSATGDVEFAARLSSLSQSISALSSLSKTSSASATLRSALEIPHTDVSILGLSYTPATGVRPYQRPGTLAISGVAKTRAALREYQSALLDAPFSATVDLPVSTYAKESNLIFTATVTLLQ